MSKPPTPWLQRNLDLVKYVIGLIFLAGMLYAQVQSINTRLDRLEHRIDDLFGKEAK